MPSLNSVTMAGNPLVRSLWHGPYCYGIISVHFCAACILWHMIVCSALFWGSSLSPLTDLTSSEVQSHHINQNTSYSTYSSQQRLSYDTMLSKRGGDFKSDGKYVTVSEAVRKKLEHMESSAGSGQRPNWSNILFPTMAHLLLMGCPEAWEKGIHLSQVALGY